jgi:hypothetical protein
MTRLRLLHCAFVTLMMLSTLTTGVDVANAAAKGLPPMSTACKGCYDDCIRNHRGPECAIHCQSRNGCPAASETLSKSPH